MATILGNLSLLMLHSGKAKASFLFGHSAKPWETWKTIGIVLFRTNESIGTSRLQDNEDFKHFYLQKFGGRPKKSLKSRKMYF